MDSEFYRPEIEEELIRRRLVMIGGGLIAPLFLWFSVIEYSLGRTDMLTLMSIGVVTCLLNVMVARFIGLNLTVLRGSVTYVFGAALYYVSINYSASSLLFCLALPVVSSFLLGYGEALVWNSVFGICCVIMIYNAPELGISSIEPYLVDFLTSYLFIMLVAYGYERMRSDGQTRVLNENKRLQVEIQHKNEIAAKNDRLFADLSDALKEVRELTGLIPICASCKKVRGDGGDEEFWEHVEAYLHKRTQLTFSHSICPGCSEEAMDALDADEDRRIANQS